MIGRANGWQPIGADVKDQFSTSEVGQLIGRSPTSVRGMIERGELESERLPGVGYRIAREAVLDLAKSVLRDEARARLSDKQVEALVERVLTHNAAVEG
jgi:excisionase family DNA binding protein